MWACVGCCSHFSGASTANGHQPGASRSWHLLKCRAANAEAIQYIHNLKLACKGLRKNASHHNTPIFVYAQTDGARPRPLTAVAVVVANDIMLLLLIWMRSNVQSVQTNTRRNAGQGNGCGWASQSLHSKVVTPVSPDQRCDVTCPMSARCRYKIVPTRQF